VEPLACKGNSSVRRPSTRTEFDIIDVSLGAKLKLHKDIVRVISDWLKFITMAQEDILHRSTYCK
jgi:hypothetical protein